MNSLQFGHNQARALPAAPKVVLQVAAEVVSGWLLERQLALPTGQDAEGQAAVTATRIAQPMPLSGKVENKKPRADPSAA